MKQIILWFFCSCAASLPLSAIEGKCASPEVTSDENAGEGSRFTRKFVDLLQNGTWCHQKHVPVGFVLNYFDFEGTKFTINDKYVSDEGTVIKDVVFLGSWSVTMGGDNVANIHFAVTEASDPDAPHPKELNLRLIGDAELQYANGDKLKHQSRGTKALCF